MPYRVQHENFLLFQEVEFNLNFSHLESLCQDLLVRLPSYWFLLNYDGFCLSKFIATVQNPAQKPAHIPVCIQFISEWIQTWNSGRYTPIYTDMHSPRSTYLHVFGLSVLKIQSDMHKIHLRGFLDTYRYIEICLHTCMYPIRFVLIRFIPRCILCISMWISVCIIFRYCTDKTVHVCAVSA